MKEIENVLRILQETKDFIEKDMINELKNLSNQTIHTATISQDADNVVIAVLVYSLSKVAEREHYRSMDGWDVFYNSVIKNLGEAIEKLKENNIEKTRENLGKIRNSLNKIDGDLGRYIKEIFRKAEINKAFKIYEHGLSSEKTAELLGISLWDLASYIGQSHISNSKIAISMPENKRLEIAENIFNNTKSDTKP